MTINELIKKLKEIRKVADNKDLFVTILSDNKWKVVDDVYMYTPEEGVSYIRIDTENGLSRQISKKIEENFK